jgi:hypothetical protein
LDAGDGRALILGLVVVGLLGQLAKPAHFAVAECTSAPLHRLSYGQVFLDDHRLQSGTGTLLGGGDSGISFAERAQYLDGELLQAPVALGAFTTTLRVRCLIVCLPITASSSTGLHSPTEFPAAERSSPRRDLNDLFHRFSESPVDLT